jgi:hypothetical protein
MLSRGRSPDLPCAARKSIEIIEFGLTGTGRRTQRKTKPSTSTLIARRIRRRCAKRRAAGDSANLRHFYDVWPSLAGSRRRRRSRRGYKRRNPPVQIRQWIGAIRNSEASAKPVAAPVPNARKRLVTGAVPQAVGTIRASRRTPRWSLTCALRSEGRARLSAYRFREQRPRWRTRSRAIDERGQLLAEAGAAPADCVSRALLSGDKVVVSTGTGRLGSSFATCRWSWRAQIAHRRCSRPGELRCHYHLGRARREGHSPRVTMPAISSGSNPSRARRQPATRPSGGRARQRRHLGAGHSTRENCLGGECQLGEVPC